MEAYVKHSLFLMLLLQCVMAQEEPQNLSAQCSCPIKHPQEKICRADIVIQGRVIGVKSLGTGFSAMGRLLEYTVKATKVFKGPETTVSRGKKIKMITSSSSGKCGVTEMETGELYIMTGLVLEGEIFFSMCEWVQPFEDLMPDQRRGLKLAYVTGCDSCLIDQQENSIPGIHDIPTSTNICYHDPLGSAHLLIEDCETMFAVCVPVPTVTGNQCAWTHNKRYNRCVSKRLKRHTSKQLAISRKTEASHEILT